MDPDLAQLRALSAAVSEGTLEAAARAGDRVVAVGGGTKGTVWTQIVSDVTGVVQELPKVTIGASYGDAWFAGVAAGVVDADSSWAEIASVVEPSPAIGPVYDELFELYVSLYGTTREAMHRIAELQTAATETVTSPR
jgi:xylulokinase